MTAHASIHATTHPRPRRGRLRCVRAGSAALLSIALATDVTAQSVVDRSDAVIGPEPARAVLALISKRLSSTDARVSDLRTGRAGAVCGSVEVRNRMGDYTGPRGFVAVPSEHFFGRLPEGPELRNPSSVAQFREMERARALYAENCTRE